MQPVSGGMRVLLILLVLVSLGVYGLQAVSIAAGAYGNLLVYRQEGNIPILFLAAEFLMATFTLVGALGLWRGAAWGRGVTLVGLGMVLYSTVNSVGWTLVNDPPGGIPIAVAFVIALVALVTLLRRS